MSTPLSDERVVEIRQRVDLLQFLGFVGITSVKLYGADDIDALRNLIGEDVPALLAEVDRLSVRLARAEHVMRRAAAELEHEEAVYLLHRYLTEVSPAGSPS